MIKNRADTLPGWTLKFEKVSNNVYKVTLTDKNGRQAATTDTDLEKAVSICEGFAFDIERQVSKSWKKFLFDTCLLKSDDKKLTKQVYHAEAFGSWYVEYGDKRIVLDGIDFVIHSQHFFDDAWADINRISLSDLTFNDFEKVLKTTD